MQAVMTPLPAGNGSPPTDETLVRALRSVRDPRTGLDIVTLGWVRHLTVVHPEIQVMLALPRPVCAHRCALETAIARALLPHLGSDRLRLHIRWNAVWDPAES
jgi:metal-sulfur cluster biosynthetic enzyme